MNRRGLDVPYGPRNGGVRVPRVVHRAHELIEHAEDSNICSISCPTFDTYHAWHPSSTLSSDTGSENLSLPIPISPIDLYSPVRTLYLPHELTSFVYSHSEDSETGGVPYIAHTNSSSCSSRSNTLSKTFQTQRGENGAYESISGPYLD